MNTTILSMRFCGNPSYSLCSSNWFKSTASTRLDLRSTRSESQTRYSAAAQSSKAVAGGICVNRSRFAPARSSGRLLSLAEVLALGGR